MLFRSGPGTRIPRRGKHSSPGSTRHTGPDAEQAGRGSTVRHNGHRIVPAHEALALHANLLAALFFSRQLPLAAISPPAQFARIMANRKPATTTYTHHAHAQSVDEVLEAVGVSRHGLGRLEVEARDRKSTRLNSSHMSESRMPASA